MTAAVSSSRPPRAKFGGWLRSSLSSIGSSLSGASGSTRSSMASSISSTMSDGDSRRSSVSLSPPKPRGRREIGALLREVMGADSNWASEAQVAKHYAQLGWGVTAIAGDGNCLFRAISDQLFGDQELYKDVRRRLVDFIERERELFAPFLELEGESVAAYCVRMRRDGEWGGNPELYAAAKCFRVHLVVHQGPQRRLRIENDDDVGKGKGESDEHEQEDARAYKTLHLLYKGDHYRSLHPSEEDTVVGDVEGLKDDAEPVEQTEHNEAEELATSDADQEVSAVQPERSDSVDDGQSVSKADGGDSEEEITVVERKPAELPPVVDVPASLEPQRQPADVIETATSSPVLVQEPQIPGARPLVCETAEVPLCGVWIPQRVVFRRGRRRLSSAVLSLVHEPSMNNLALSVTTEIEFEDADVKKQASAGSTTATTTTVEVEASEPQSESGGDEERASVSISVANAVTEHEKKKKRPQVAETVEDSVPVVFARRTRFHKGKPKRAAASHGGAQQRASMY